MNFDEAIYCLSEPDGAYVSYFRFLAISSMSAPANTMVARHRRLHLAAGSDGSDTHPRAPLTVACC